MSKGSFGEWCQAQRVAADVTQQFVAEKLGYTSPQFISNVERGICWIPAQQVRKWSATVKVDWKVTLRKMYDAKYSDAVIRLGGKNGK